MQHLELQIAIGDRLTSVKSTYWAALLTINGIFISIFAGLIFISDIQPMIKNSIKAIVILSFISSILIIIIYRLFVRQLDLTLKSAKALGHYTATNEIPKDSPKDPGKTMDKILERIPILGKVVEILLLVNSVIVLFIIFSK